jgi:ABC-type bacteriocin/lantibiotic exporter with double-glycine peptidase domain
MSPLSMKLVQQTTDYDCGIACLSMLLQEEYVEVHAAAAKALKKWPSSSGLTTRQMQTIAKKLGHTLKSIEIRTPDTSITATGILLVGAGRKYHFVTIFQGIVIEPTYNRVWNLQTYLKHYKSRPIRFLEP